MSEITLDDVRRTVKSMAATALRNEKYFSDLDAAAGDADFGTSLASGFRVVDDDWDEIDKSSIGDLLLRISMIITSNVGGCSGPIWGTAFMRAGALSRDCETLTLEQVEKMMTAAIEGIQKRGGAELGDKTLLDALAPVRDVIKNHIGEANVSLPAVLKESTQAANEAIESTKGWEAKRGRQSFTGARSIGTPDPGIVAVATMLNDLCTEFGIVLDE